MIPPSAGRVALVLAVAILAVSTAGTLVKLAPDAPPLSIAFWRVAVAAMILLPGARPVAKRDVWLTALGGLFLALHFWAWFLSLRETTVMRSTLLVCLTPVWTALFEWAFFRSKPTPRFGAGIAIALGGVGPMVAGGGASGGGGSVTGDALAALGGLLGAAYFTIGRAVRARVPIAPYGALSCAATAAWLGVLTLASGDPFLGFADDTWLAILALALGPQLLGHLGFNYAVGRLPAAIVAAVILLEPIGATAVAAGVLGERPGWMDGLGGVLALVGVAVAVMPRRTSVSS